MMSIQPKWCELIANGKKTIEVRKTRPKLETPFKCYIYCTKPKMRLGAYAIGYDFEAILQMNIDKLKARYPDGFEVERSKCRREGDE